MDIRVLLISREANLSDDQIADIRQAAGDGVAIRTCDRESVIDLARDADILAGVDLGIPPQVFSATGRLRWVHVFHAGVETLLSPELSASGLTLTCGKGAHAIPIAEHAFAFMLAHVKDLVGHRVAQQQRRWDRHALGELSDRTMCVVGLGNIGREIARRATCFGMRVVGASRHARPVDGVDRVVAPDQVRAILPEADFVVVATPISPETDHLIGRGELAAMKRGAFLVNISRGRVIDQDALIDALASGHLSGAGLDATDPEPLPAESPLWTLPNVMITPHDSGMSDTVKERTVRMLCDNLRRYRADEPLHQRVDLRAGY